MANVDGIRGLQARLDALGDTPKDVSREWGLRTVAGAKESVRRKTGTTSRTIRLAEVSADGARVEVGGAGAFLEYGTRAHIIRPRKARMLRFPAQGTKTTLAGRVRVSEIRKKGSAAYTFRRIVRHPGTKPYPFLLPAARAALEIIGIRKFIDAWNKAN